MIKELVKIGNSFDKIFTRMAKPFLRSLFFFLIFCSGYQLAAQENYEVRRVDFHGNKTLDSDFLLDRMAVKELSYLEKLITNEQPFLFNRRLVELDMERLKRIYQSEGFLNAEVKLDPLEINEKKQIVKLSVQIEEGEPVLIDSVAIVEKEALSGIDLDSLQKKVFREMELRNGKRFRDEWIKHDVQAVENAFRNLGHAYVKVSYELDLRPDEFKTSIFYSVEPGPVSYFGETRIEGHKHVEEAFVRKQLVYKEGELYNKSLLTETRQNLYFLQLFRIVSVQPQTDAATQRSPIPVKLFIEEAPRLTTRFGVGYGTEDKFRTFLDLNYLGFLGSARRIRLYLKHSALEPYHVSLKWIQPQFLGKKSTISINPFLSRNSEPGYETRTYGLNVPVTYRFNSRLNSTVTYYLEEVEQRVEEGDVELPDPEDDKFAYNKSGMLFSAVFDNSIPKFSPEEGVKVSLGFKLNGYVFGSDFNYTRLWGDIRHYQEIGDWVLALRLMAGNISSPDSSGFIPVEDRFYAGGSNSVRGWNRSELGPRRESGTPIGGNSIVEGNIEFRYPLFWRFSGVVFLEAGNVWRESFTYRLNDLGYAAGGGLRIETPIGPIRLDLGVPVWNEKRSPQFFISVGQAF
ncbi:BamA/TamA family outer membrane protein [uncultured Sunxiuqinia sp.]|uniref:BamA/OMP85 family outer membrane protein n=1 Tax=uncultured Sunxiuqinia sp. TaxID=1573825 RepID=UPI0030D73292|tara:strand:+ start:77563 stop:79449 length:1887 start_codon:yes stop_codon:yes gene_type:complete